MSADFPGPAPSDAPQGSVPAGSRGPRRPPRPGRNDGDDTGRRSKSARRAPVYEPAEPVSAATAFAPAPAAFAIGGTGTARIDRTGTGTVPGTGPGPRTEPTTVHTVAPSQADVDPEHEQAPSVPAPRPVGGRRRGRRVRRVVRRIDLWSVLKLALVVYTCIYAAVLGTIAALWGLAYKSGQIDKLTSFLSDVGLENYHFYGDQMFKACAAIGAVGVLAGTVITVLATFLVNVISEITGGIRFTVIEEDV